MTLLSEERIRSVLARHPDDKDLGLLVEEILSRRAVDRAAAYRPQQRNVRSPGMYGRKYKR